MIVLLFIVHAAKRRQKQRGDQVSPTAQGMQGGFFDWS